MATTQPDFPTYELRVSAYEHVASMLISLLVLIGATVLIMFILWLTSRIFASEAAVPVQLEDIGTGDSGLSGGMELDAPMAEELGVESDLETPNLEQTLAAVADAVATQVALLDDPALTEEALSGKGGSTGDGRGLGRGSGPGGTGKRRQWEVRFPPGNTIESYGRQLDFFKIELGVLMPNNKVIYASNFSTAPTRHEGPSDQEKRYYLTWRKGGLEQADRELLAKARVEPGRWILKFISPELEKQLIQLERNKAGDKAKSISTTYFGIRPKGRGYEFYVIDQTYR
ncbi:MAG TPA: hypothetical protein VMY37_17515 [Thermoguttaceae bacterium]|nr:hypothetical protein [Thermoguttaceae bacterium]